MTLSKKQINYLTTSFFSINLAAGSIRSGKTHIQLYRWLYFIEAEAIENVDCLIVGKKNDAIVRNIIVPMLDIVEKEGLSEQYQFINQPRRLIYKPKNITMYCEGANDEGSEARIRGMTIQGLLGDEVTLWPRSFFMQSMGRLSAGKRYSFLTCNPDVPSHYIQTELIEKIHKHELNGKVYYFTLIDNPALSPDYVKQIKKLYTGVFYERFIEGKWVMSEGLIYHLFNRKEHVIKDYPVNRIKEYVLGIDWGYENPLAILLIAIDEDETYYIIDEIYERHCLLNNELIVKMKNKGWFDLKKNGRAMPIDFAYADPSRPDYLQVFYDLTKIRTIPALNIVNEGIQTVQRKYIKKDNGEYGIYCLEKCINYIKEKESYKWKTSRDGMGKDEPDKASGNDHLMDGERYVIYTRERGRIKFLNEKEDLLYNNDEGYYYLKDFT